MRKLIVLIITSVLATGAVANADTVNVVNNPADFIVFNGIFEDTNADGTFDVSMEGKDMIVHNPIEQNPSNIDNYYQLKFEVLDSAETLEQVAVCIYDSDALSGDAIATNCGSGYVDPLTDLLRSSNITGEYAPQSAININFSPGTTRFDASREVGPDNSVLVANKSGTSRDYHRVLGRNFGKSVVAQKGTFDGVEVDSGTATDDEVWDVDIMFAPSYLGHNSGNWNVRLLAIYSDGTEVESLDTKNYGIGYWGAFAGDLDQENPSNPRTSKDFEDLIPGENKTITGITTGSYHTNNNSDITLSASKFAQGGTELEFDVDGTPGTGTLSFECSPTTSGVSQFLAADTAVNLFTNVDPNSQEANPDDELVLDTHDCTLYLGTGVDTGTYTNVMTVGIKKNG